MNDVEKQMHMPGSAVGVLCVLSQIGGGHDVTTSPCRNGPEAGHCFPSFSSQVSMCVSVHVCLCVCVSTYVFVWSVHVYACRSHCVCMSVCACVCVCLCVCVFMCRLGGPRGPLTAWCSQSCKGFLDTELPLLTCEPMSSP